MGVLPLGKAQDLPISARLWFVARHPVGLESPCLFCIHVRGEAAMLSKTLRIILVAAVCMAAALRDRPLSAETATPAPLATETIDFLQTHCAKCHQGERPKGKLDVSKLGTVQSL